RLFGAASAAQVRLRGANALWMPYWTEQQARIRAALGDAVFDEVYGQGAALTLDEAVALALSVDHPDLAAGSGRFATDSQASCGRAGHGRAAGRRAPQEAMLLRRAASHSQDSGGQARVS